MPASSASWILARPSRVVQIRCRFSAKPISTDISWLISLPQTTSIRQRASFCSAMLCRSRSSSALLNTRFCIAQYEILGIIQRRTDGHIPQFVYLTAVPFQNAGGGLGRSANIRKRFFHFTRSFPWSHTKRKGWQSTWITTLSFVQILAIHVDRHGFIRQAQPLIPALRAQNEHGRTPACSRRR